MDNATQKRLDEMVLRKAELELEQAEEQHARHAQQKAANAKKNSDRQRQLRADVDTRRKTVQRCNHRQGGTPKNPLKGKGPTALKIATMPDGFTKLIMCSAGCNLRAFSPHPQDGAKKPHPGESNEERNARLAKFKKDTAEWERLQAMAEDGLTEESVQPMECGVTMSVFDGDGMPVYPRRPCDSYATHV